MMGSWILLTALAAAPADAVEPAAPADEEPAAPEQAPATEEPPAQEPPAQESPAVEEPPPAQDASGEPVVAQCPCPPTDVACRKQHDDVCLWAGGTSAAQQAEPEPAAPDGKPKAPDPYVRTGVILGAGLGYGTCVAAYCEDFRGGFAANAEVGWRWRFVAPVLTIGGTVGPLEIDGLPGFRGHMGLLDVMGGVLFFPSLRSKFDPFLGVHLGYTQSTVQLRRSDVTLRERISRGGVRLSAGLLFLVHPNVSVGPRFDFTLPFAGRACVDASNRFGSIPTDCIDLADLPEDSLIDPRDLPKPLSVTVHVRGTIPTGDQRRR